MIRISFIIPVYNAEKYIEDCIDSLLMQMTNDVEVIVVDDGSIDNSIGLITQKISTVCPVFFSNFKIISQVNLGQSVARNNAIDIAKGEYIAFIDADDIISSDYIKKVLNIINLYNPDFIRIGAKQFKLSVNDSISYLKNLNIEGEVKLNENEIVKIFNDNYWYPWLYIFNKKIIKDFYFPAGMYFEDAHLIPELILRSKNFYCDETILYYYRENFSGSSLSRKKSNIEKILFSSNQIKNVYFDRLTVNTIYSAGYLSFSKLYISYLMEFEGLRASYKAQKAVNKNLIYVDIKKVKNLNLKIYYYFKFKLIFLLFVAKYMLRIMR